MLENVVTVFVIPVLVLMLLLAYAKNCMPGLREYAKSQKTSFDILKLAIVGHEGLRHYHHVLQLTILLFISNAQVWAKQC